MNLLSELRDILAAFEEANIEYAVCGGLALAVFAMPRATLDIDLLALPNDLDIIVDLLEPLGYRMNPTPLFYRGGGLSSMR
jgi:hypothetical protein